MEKPAQKFIQKVKESFKSIRKIFLVKFILYLGIVVAIFLLIKPEKTKEYIQLDGHEQESYKSLPETGEGREVYKVASSIPDSDESIEIIHVDDPDPIYSITINADVTLPKPDSFVRTILFDDAGNEYLIFESYLLLDGAESFSITDSCEETCLLDGVIIRNIEVITENAATINITKVNKDTTVTAFTQLEKNEQREALLDEKVTKINAEIENNNLKWEAGKTLFSRLTYTEKKKMFDGDVPNFQGLEFYKGGVFETIADSHARNTKASTSIVQTEQKNFVENMFSMVVNFFKNGSFETETDSGEGEVKSLAASSQYVDSWDWRNRHGADDPSSYYFDGNPDSQETGNGWITSVKNQGGCGSCWAFAATGATEALVNLYYNQHIDLDLAEQDALSCSGAGSCSGGWPGVTLDYYTTTGVVDESCFPYTATDQPCNNKCSSPSERIRISGKVTFSNKTEDNLKSLILEYGPISGGVYSWSHAMTLVGWYTDGIGDTVWIFKNSWGKTWGDHGYLYLKTSITNIGWTHALMNPIIDLNSRTTSCIDADNDGYYNWGISEGKPASCPVEAPEQADCDDSDPSLASFDSSYDCTGIPSDIYFNVTSHNFQNTPVGQTTSPKEIIIGNRGDEDIEVSNIQILNTDDFILNLNPTERATPCGQIDPVIAPGNSCSIEVSFSPKSETNHLTKILVSSSDTISPSSWLTLTGTGSDDPETVCTFFQGSWLNETSKCFGISEQICNDYGGAINQCDSYCTPSFGCFQVCVPSCRF